MGVVNICQYPIPDGLSGQQAVDNLIKVLEQLGAKKKGNFLVDCETYYSAPTIEPARVLNLIHNSDQPATCYALLDTGTSIAVDNNFDILMLTMSGLYQTKKSTKMECKGPRYELDDFVIKIGSVSIGPSFKGILIELEYKPCVIPKFCWDIMTEFMSKFMIAPKSPHNHLQNISLEYFTPKDTTQQYNEQFNNLRKTNQAKDAFNTTTTAQTSNLTNTNSPSSNISVQGVNPAKLNLNN